MWRHTLAVLVGVVSDTHNNLRNVERIVEIFNRAGVDRVVHTGDITQAKTLAVLARLTAPLCGVFGNNDLERDHLEAACRLHDFDFADGVRHFTWSERRIVLVHDPLDAPPTDAADVILHGHNHRTVIDRRAGVLLFNPGECAGHMSGHNRVGILDLTTLTVQIETF